VSAPVRVKAEEKTAAIDKSVESSTKMNSFMIDLS
jgi:hypothetical protein